jgi:hypothetical protein
MSEAERVFAGTPPRALVTAAEDVLCPDLPWDRQAWASQGGCERDAVFTVITPYPDRAARALLRVASRFMDVDEDGREIPGQTRHAAMLAGQYEPGHEPYTPNCLHGVFCMQYAALVALDTKGELPRRWVGRWSRSSSKPSSPTK